MQFSYNWLSDYVDTESPQEAAEALTGAGLSVELVEAHETSSGETDHVLEIEVTTNRPDAMNHFGLAREIAVVLGRELREPAPGLAGLEAEADSIGARITVEAPDLCPRFTARVVEGVTIGSSPQWMADRLEAIGVRPINNVVDITNYLLWEWGQPQHAYDLDTLTEHTIVVRRAREGETIVTLDGEERQLSEGMCMICDPARTIGIGGVMGGLDTEVTEKTTRILLESAWFDPLSVRLTARRLGLHTDASHRFERGADYELALRANDRACQLLAELAGGRVLPGAIDVRSDERLRAPGPIEVSPAAMVAFAGVDIDSDNASRWLRGLGFEVEELGIDENGNDLWSVTPPSWRVHDVELRADVYEEVMRIFGFDNIPAVLPAMRGADAAETITQRRRRLVREHMVACGFAEAIDWAFHSQELDAALPLLVEGEPIRLANPLSELYSMMRRSLLPGLLASALFNQRRGSEAIRLFEIGHVFGSEESEALAMIAGGRLSSPWQRRRDYDLFDIKGVFESLAETVRLECQVRPASVRGLIEGTSGEIWTRGEGKEPRRVGHFGQLDRTDLPYPLFAFEVLTEALGDETVLGGVAREIEPPSRFPGIAADLTLTHPVEKSWYELSAAVESFRSSGGVPDLQDFELIDRYQGKGVPDGAVNTTVSFRYGSHERSLTQEEVNEQHRALNDALEQSFGIG